MNKDIREYTLKEITDFFIGNNEKTFRAKQVYEWLWKKHVTSFSEMKNLSKETIALLENNFKFNPLVLTHEQQSADQTIKLGFSIVGNHVIEGVLIPSSDRVTACISTQAGCALKCKFCATGDLGFKRHLRFYEITEQVFILNKHAEKHFGRSLSNIVIMGMGEPLMNYDAVMKAINILTSSESMGMSPQRITLSTAGVVEGIKRLADDGIRFQLAISLHTANNQKRSSLMPVNKSNPLDKLSEAIQYFHKKTESRITYEYLLIGNFNDSIIDAKELAEFCKISPCKINLIELNSTANSDFIPASQEKVEAFKNFLESKNLIVNVRKSKGQDIDAACGQLANKTKKK